MEYKEGISVIIPVYNTENYLSNCLKSVINQRYKKLEILCVLDANSSDGSERILNQYAQKDSRIKILKPTEGCSQGYNRNLGIENAGCEYIGFVDSDDIIDLDYYEHLINNAEFFNADVVLGEITIINSGTQNIIKTCKYPLTTEYTLLKKINLLQQSVCWDKLYKTRLLKEHPDIRFPVNLLHEDNLFILKLMNACNKIATAPGACYHWIRNANSLCFNKELAEKRMDDSGKILHEILNLLPTLKTTPQENRIIINFFIKRFGWMAMSYPRYRTPLQNKIDKLTQI